MTVGENGMQDAGGELPVELGLAAAAAEVTIGPVPVEGIVAGGRRIRRRRRSALGALTLASVVALGGGTAAGLNGLGGNGRTAQALQAGDGAEGGECIRVSGHTTPVVTEHGPGERTMFEETTIPCSSPPPQPAGDRATPEGGKPAPSSSASSSAQRDPLQPVRQLAARGGLDGGRNWQLWESLWPAAPKDKAYEQAVLIWEERRRFDPALEKPTEPSVKDSWKPDQDVVDFYAELDGARVGPDTLSTVPAPGRLSPEQAKSVRGSVLGAPGTPGALPTRLAVLVLGPDVDRVETVWSDQGRADAAVKDLQLGGSPYRVAVVREQPGARVVQWRFFDRQGVELPDPGLRLLMD
ncbi:hypothetical protein [Kitasatospora sp. NPDC004531]